jgi:hypothetical protein
VTDQQQVTPLTPADCDLRDFAFMPLDVVRLRDSDLAATESPEACWAAVLLWAASWHQVPAASLPDDDRVLANLAGYGRVVREWQKMREGALRGWITCTDGRMYHPVVAEKANEAWKGKLERLWRTECARMKKHFQRHEMPVVLPEFHDWLTSGRPQGQALPVPGDIPNLSRGQGRETGSKGQGEGKGEGQGQGQKKRRGAKAPSSADLPTWMQAIVGVYHEVLPELPGVVVMNAERQQAMRDFREWVLNSKLDGKPRATNDEEMLAWTRKYFERARNNDWLMGRSPRSAEHRNWKPSIEWLLSAKGMQTVIEKTEAAT